MTKIAQEVQDVLSRDPSEVQFEAMAAEEASPLNQPVIEKDIAGMVTSPHEGQHGEETTNEEQEATQIPFEPLADEGPLDAPEQEIDETGEWPIAEDTTAAAQDTNAEASYELPASHAKQAADAFLGITDNFLEIGGGFFVKVKKHSDFYDFDEIIEVIDEHNHKNVQRLQLSAEDKALLRPLLAEVLKKRAKKLTPEQQLVGAIISIMVKKVQLVLEVRAENEVLVNRIREVIREERPPIVPGPEEEVEGSIHQEEADEEMPVAEVETIGPAPATDGLSVATVLEVADEEGPE